MGLVLIVLALLPALAAAQTRIKDVATVEGARDNQLIGYGLVAGLDGSGDSDKLFTQQTISNMARRFGIQIDPDRDHQQERGDRDGHGERPAPSRPRAAS